MDKPQRKIDLLLYENANIIDISGPAQVFSSALIQNEHAYQLCYVSVDGQPIRTSCGLRLTPDAQLAGDSNADDLIIPGGKGTDDALKDSRIIQTIANWRNTRPDGRIISVCSGALILAQAGVLDNIPATTHWNRAVQAKAQFPQVDWQTDNLYFATPPVMTSAGITAGIDLSLAIVRQDCGAQAALTIARELVVYLQRSGGQNQFSDFLEAQFLCNDRLQPLVDHLIQQPQSHWTLETMADYAHMTPRTLSRYFNKDLQMSPMQFLERIRVKKASDAISAGSTNANAIGLSGFTDFQHMQRAFKRQLNVTVGAFEKRFGQNTSGK